MALRKCLAALLLLVATAQGRSVLEDFNQEVSNETETSVVAEQACSCEKRFFRHYEVKGCQPVYRDGCDCPERFDCPETFMENSTVCYYEGKEYAQKDKIPNTNPCRICSCERGFGDTMEITCVSVECGYMFNSVPLAEGCYRVQEQDKCCPTEVKCDDSSVETGIAPDEPTCEVEGKIYHLGQYIDSGNQCLNCICHQNWTGVNEESCRPTECMLEEKRPSLKQGCLPIYHESTCCPIEFHCDSPSEVTSVIHNSVGNDTDPRNQCTFGDSSGNVGDVLSLKRSNNCVTCTCTTPPEFTCVHKRCPGPPNDDYEHCHSTYTPGECCATYDCIQAAPSRLICDPVYCEDGCTEVFVPYGCPICRCDKVLCSPPKCSDDCVIDYDSKPCPSCKCITTFDLSRPMCGPVKCSPQCHEAISPQGCPMCVCGPLCSPPKCGPGCHVQTDFTEGECPGCVCFEDESLTDQVPKILCSPVKCPASCSEATGEHGCPMCLCDVMCSPPKCDVGCRAEVVPSSGPCPGCVCDEPVAPQCSPVKCSAGCVEYTPPNGCPLCQCSKLLCSMPKCPEGCQINYDIAPGTCPDCRCPASISLDRPQCGPVKCGPQCYEGVSPQGCPMCVCGPLCSPPKCGEGCVMQTDIPEGQCPGCDCPDKNAAVQCGTVNCPSFCSQATNEFGCPMCHCEVLCSPPKCDAGCRAEIVPSSGPCPGCICNIERPLCGPVKCGPECYETISPQGCPMCVCGPLCSPPRCELGCRIQRNVPEGECPGCECDTAPLQGPMIPPQIACSIPQCPPGCKLENDPAQGPCPACSCDDTNNPGDSTGPMIPPQIACSIPRCPPGCKIENDPAQGPCPYCACDDTANPDDSTDAESFPFCPPVQCGQGCVEEGQADMCPACRCNGECVPPICPADCHAETNAPPGQCPACTCPIKTPQGNNCPDLPCQHPCTKVRLTPYSCPVCECGRPLAKPFLKPAGPFGAPSVGG